MSVAVKGSRSTSELRSKCAARMWKVFPHLFLCLSLVGYAALGAWLFQYLEGGNEYEDAEYRKFLGEMVTSVQNSTQNIPASSNQTINDLKKHIRDNFKAKWLQSPKRWSFTGSMFFCCTVFTTVGYGEIYPVTLPGKVACILYAMVGIPLMLLVISDVGDILAVLMSTSYRRLHKFCKKLLYRTWSPLKAQDQAGSAMQCSLEDGTFLFNHDVVVGEPMDIRDVIRSQGDVKKKSVQLRNNALIFEKILARENFARKGPLLRSLSCPELDRMPKPPSKCAIWDFTGIGGEMEQLNVPFTLILIVVFAYISFVGRILPIWETDWETKFDSYYFCFITLTTIGFGDIVPKHPNYFMLTSLFIIIGMAIMSMAIKLGQSRIVSCYKQCMRFVSRGNALTPENEDND